MRAERAGAARWKGWLLALALAGSLTANVVQLARGGDDHAGAVASDRSRVADRKSAPAASALPIPPSASCEQQVQALERQRAAIALRIEDERPVAERYERGAPDPAQTAELRATVDRAFEAAGIRARYDLSCQGAACRLQFPASVAPPSGWESALFSSPEFVERVEDKATMGPGRALFPLRRDRARGETKAALLRVVKAFKQGPAPARCLARHPASGRLDAAVWIPEEGEGTPVTGQQLDNGVAVWLGGELGGTDFGACMAEALREAVLAATLPPHRAPAKVATNFTLPSS